MDLGGRSLKGQMKQAGRMNVPWVVIVGPEEWERDAAVLRNMRAGEQHEVPLARLRRELLDRAGDLVRTAG
jgi:histidyl-tRNA synthetase